MTALYKPKSQLHVCPACKHEEPFMRSLGSMERCEAASHPDCMAAIKAAVHRAPEKRAHVVFMTADGEVDTAFAEVCEVPGDARRGARRGSLVLHAHGRVSLEDPSVKILVGPLPRPNGQPTALTEGTLIELDVKGRAREIQHLFAPYSVVAAHALSCDHHPDEDFDDYSSEEEYVTDDELDDPIPEPLPEPATEGEPVQE